MRPPLLILLLLAAGLSAPAFAQDDSDQNAPDPAPTSARGVGARTTYEEATPNMGPDSAEEVVAPLPPMRTLSGTTSIPKSQLPSRKPAAPSDGAAAGNGGVTCNGSGCELTAKTPYKMEVSKDLPSMKLHAGAHGGMVFGPNNGYSVGFFAPVDGTPRTGVIIGSMPPFPNQGCALAFWISAAPGGAPLVGSTWKEAIAGGCAGYAAGEEGEGQFLFSSGSSSVGRRAGCPMSKGVRAYLNVVPNMPPYVANEAPWWGNHPDWNGVWGWRQVICDEAVSSPLGVPDPSAPATAGGADAGAGGPVAPPRPKCNVCAYANRSTHSCLSCEGDPVNCNICPSGTPGSP